MTINICIIQKCWLPFVYILYNSLAYYKRGQLKQFLSFWPM